MHIAKLENLRTLDRNGKGITDAGLLHLGGLLQLRELDTYETSVTGAAREKLKGRLPNF